LRAVSDTSSPSRSQSSAHALPLPVTLYAANTLAAPAPVLVGAVSHSPSRSAVVSFYSLLDSLLIRARMHTVWSQTMFMALLCIPRLVYFVWRLGVTEPYRTWSSVGCRLDYADMYSFMSITIPFFVMTLPLLLRLRSQHDTLLIRYELAAQLFAFPPFVVWYFVGKFTDADITAANGDYASLGVMLVIDATSLWAPALASYWLSDFKPRSAQIAPAPEPPGGPTRSPSTNRVDTDTSGAAAALSLTSPGSVGMRVVAELAASGLLDAPPSLRRLLRVLETPPHAIVQQLLAATPNYSDLSIIAALLVGTGWGFRTMRGLVSQELAGEPLAFIRASAALRTIAAAAAAALHTAAAADTVNDAAACFYPEGGNTQAQKRRTETSTSIAYSATERTQRRSASLGGSAGKRAAVVAVMESTYGVPVLRSVAAVQTTHGAARPSVAATQLSGPLANVIRQLRRTLDRYVIEGAPLQVRSHRLSC
jgi:hypothetical protein